MASDSNFIWRKMFEKWMRYSDDIVMESLTCSGSPNFIHDLLHVEYNYNTVTVMCVICKPHRMQHKDHVIRFFLIVAKHAKNKITLDYIIRNFEKIKPR